MASRCGVARVALCGRLAVNPSFGLAVAGSYGEAIHMWVVIRELPCYRAGFLTLRRLRLTVGGRWGRLGRSTVTSAAGAFFVGAGTGKVLAGDAIVVSVEAIRVPG